MSFGLRTWGSDGTIQMDTDTFTYQVIHNQVYSFGPGVVYDVAIPEFSTRNCVAAMLPTGVSGPSGYETMPYQTVREGFVRMSAYHPNATNMSSKLEMSLLVMRYKN